MIRETLIPILTFFKSNNHNENIMKKKLGGPERGEMKFLNDIISQLWSKSYPAKPTNLGKLCLGNRMGDSIYFLKL